MYETVKVVKGYAITRMIGYRGCYHVTIEETKNFRKEFIFKTIKSAVEFIEKSL